MVQTVDAYLAHEIPMGVVGLGYVGLPLAVQLGRHYEVVGFDINPKRIDALKQGVDSTLEVTSEALGDARIQFTHEAADLSACGLIVVAVPTPIDAYRIPDLGPLKSASQLVGQHMPKNCCVVYESTVYPGATEDVCVPILERASGLQFGRDFTVGYSPERINPGDHVHTIDRVIKIVSGSDVDTQQFLSAIYGRIVKAGIHVASSIKVAEAAKVIENTQRDLNIALMNELSMIFDRLQIDTLEVIEAAATKWNFLPFRPGLVGGHCIGVDPYYLTVKAESVGYHPEMILAGRRVNDQMGKFIAERTVKQLIRAGKPVFRARIGVLGLTFKEDVPDLRNSKVVDIVRELSDYGIDVLVHDPLADVSEASALYDIDLVSMVDFKDLDGVIIAVCHRDFKRLNALQICHLCRGDAPLIVDVKGIFNPDQLDVGEINLLYWRL